MEVKGIEEGRKEKEDQEQENQGSGKSVSG